MIAVGEQTGALDQMLSKIADFYEDEVDNAVGALKQLIEPIMILFLGIAWSEELLCDVSTNLQDGFSGWLIAVRTGRSRVL